MGSGAIRALGFAGRQQGGEQDQQRARNDQHQREFQDRCHMAPDSSELNGRQQLQPTVAAELHVKSDADGDNNPDHEIIDVSPIRAYLHTYHFLKATCQLLKAMCQPT